MTIDQLKTLRNGLGLTQAEMAARIGVSHRTYSRWETGVLKPSEAMSRWMREIARLNRITIDEEERQTA